MPHVVGNHDLKILSSTGKYVFPFYTREIILFSWRHLSDDENKHISKISFHTTKPPNKWNHRNRSATSSTEHSQKLLIQIYHIATIIASFSINFSSLSKPFWIFYFFLYFPLPGSQSGSPLIFRITGLNSSSIGLLLLAER